MLVLSLLPLPGPALGEESNTTITPEERAALVQEKRAARITQEQREAAAARQALLKASAKAEGDDTGAKTTMEMPMPAGTTPDYFGVANWAFSPPLKKFIDGLPLVGPENANENGQYLTVAHPDTTTYPGSDYYEIELQQYTEQLHSELPPTTLRGYVQVNNGTDAAGNNTIEPDPIHYLGPTIFATKDRPVRVKFTNKLPIGEGGDLFLPVDTTVMGAGMGPLMMDVPEGKPMNYSQNRATIHLHGGKTPWISDGTPHQWITPAGENTAYPKGVSVRNVPDMPDPGDGSMTFFYSNQQSARMLWYHDHAYGITRLNVYSGMASGYFITDDVEKKLVADGIIPADEIPLVVQDKTFVDATKILDTDPLWNWGTGMKMGDARMPNTGDLWMPHVYMTAQNPFDIEGVNPFGRWHYGPWFWPPTKNITHGPVPNPLYGTDPVQPPENPGVPDVSMGMESFFDTPIVNGTAFPYTEVEPKAYRFRILNAANDRFWNLQMYRADETTFSVDGRGDTEVKMVPASVCATNFPENWPTDGREGGVPDPATAGPDWIQIGTESGFLAKPAIVPNQPITWNLDPTTFNFGNVDQHSLLLGPAERADVVVDFSKYAGQTLILYNDAPAAFPALDARYDYYTGAPDMTDTGGHSGPQVGFGPNTRTVMQIKVADVDPAPEFDIDALNAAFTSTETTPGVFESSQDPIIVGQSAYDSAYNTTFPSEYPDWGVSRIQDNEITFKTTEGDTVTMDMEPKAIQDEMGEAFDPEYGRMSGFLGLERPNTIAGTQNFMLYPFGSPPVEILESGMDGAKIGELGDGTQIWKITHNGVDTHPVHFHLYDVQLVNRVGWDGAIRLPDDNELGWKETVRVSPLEDTIVALRPKVPDVPFKLGNSVRMIDPSMPEGAILGMGMPLFDPDGQPVEIRNHLVNFGAEYMIHCHILSHEEMDMMHTVAVGVRPETPTGLTAVATGNGATRRAVLNWTDQSLNETGFTIERATDAAFTAGVVRFTVPADVTTYSDTIGQTAQSYYYRVYASNTYGDTAVYPAPSIGFPNNTLMSAASNVAPLTAPQSGLAFQMITGPNRYATAVAASKAAFPTGASTVVVATGENWPDAITGSALAGAVNGPLLLTYSEELPAVTRNEITRLGATKAIVLGSGTAVQSRAYNQLVAQLGAANVKRIGGATRYETADLVAREVKATIGTAYTGVAFVATGGDYPDATTASAVAAAQKWPVFLSRTTGLSASTRSAMTAIGVNHVVILGGTAAVSSATEASLAAYNPGRVGGADKYATSANVALFAVQWAGFKWDFAGLATGENFPDALVGGVLQGKDKSVMLLTRTSTLSSPAAAVLRINRGTIGTIRLYGSVATTGMRNQVTNALR